MGGAGSSLWPGGLDDGGLHDAQTGPTDPVFEEREAPSADDPGCMHAVGYGYDLPISQRWNQSYRVPFSHPSQPHLTGEGPSYDDTHVGRNLEIVMRDTNRDAFAGMDCMESMHLDDPEGEGRQGIQTTSGKGPESSRHDQGPLSRAEHRFGLAAPQRSTPSYHDCTYGSTANGPSASSYGLPPTGQTDSYITHPLYNSVPNGSHRSPSVCYEAYRKLEVKWLRALRDLEQSEGEKTDLRSRLATEEHRRIETLQKLERLEALHLQRVQPESGSYQDSAATPPLLQNAADGVKEAIVVCAREFYLSFRKSSSVVAHALQVDLPVERRSKEVVKAGIQEVLCRVLFQNFEDPYLFLRKKDVPLFQTPSERKSALFQDFKRCRDYSDPKQLLQDDEDFRSFFFCKTAAMNAEIRVSLLAVKDLHITVETIDNGVLNPENKNSIYYKAFLRTAKNVWVVNKLAMAFEPIAEIFRVGRGSSLNPIYMEDVATHDDDEDAEADENMEVQKQVMFMCVPGFTVRRTVIKSRVFCLPNVQPEAHETDDFANPAATGAASDDLPEPPPDADGSHCK